MRIGQFTDSFYPIVDGVGRVVYNYANGIPRLGDECYVIAPMVDTGYRGGYPFELVDYTGAPVPGSPQYKAGLAVLDRHYYERMDMITMDIVHAHTPFFAGQEALRLAMRNDVPLVGTFHSKYYDDFYKATHAELLANIGVRVVVDFYEHCDEVWAVSGASAAVLRDYGYRGNITVVENGTELAAQRPEDKAAAAERFKLDTEHPIFLYVGQLNWKKNILLILEAAAILKTLDERFTLVLVGQGPDEKAIAKKAEELGIGDSVLFTGHLADSAILNGLYQCATIFTFPSIYDTFSLVVREAAAMGTPSVLAAGSCAAEAVDDNVNGFICEPTAESLAWVLKDNMHNERKLAEIGERALETIPVPWDKVLVNVRERYSELIERGRNDEARKHRRQKRQEFFNRLFGE